jgi:hypothetical protein
MPSDRMPSDRMAARLRSDRVAEHMRPDRVGADRVSSDRMGPDRMSRDRMGPERSSRPVRTGPPQSRGAAGRNAGYPRVSQGGRPLDARNADRRPDSGRDEEQRVPERPSARQPQAARPRSQAAETGGGRLRGIVAVIGVFLVTLAGAGADSFVGIGLGLITLVCLVAATVVATLLVRRRDLISVVVSPPLVFVAVAAANIGLAPSAHFNLPTVATLLVRGFPSMAIATGAAIVLALFRLAARR